MGEVNLEGVSSSFTNVGFVVREISKEDGVFILEYNYPNDNSAILMRAAILKHGGQIFTFYKLLDRPAGIPGVAARERLLFNYKDEEQLRTFLRRVLNTYLEYTDHMPVSKENPLSGKGSKTVNIFGGHGW